MRYLIFYSVILIYTFISSGCASYDNEILKPDTTKYNAAISNGNKSVPLAAEQALPLEIKSLSMEETIRLALLYNPALKAGEKDIDAASARIIQAKLWPNPSLFMETSDGRKKSYGFGGDYKSVIGVSQPIVLGGKIDASTKLAQKGKEIELANYEQLLRETITQVKSVFIRILASQELVKAAASNLEIARNIFESASTRVEAKAASEIEKIKTEIELAHAELDLTNAQNALFQAQKELNAILGNIDIKIENYDGALNDAFPPIDNNKTEEAIISGYPEIIKSKKAREYAGSQLTLAKTQRYPDIELGLGAGKQRGNVDQADSIEWSLNIPLPVFNRNQGSISEAQALLTKADREYENTLNRVLLQAKNTLSLFNTLIIQAKSYNEKIMPQAEKSLSLVSEGYQAGKFTYLDLLDAQRTLSQTKQSYINLLRDLNMSSVDIEKLTGQAIDKFNKEK